MKTDQEMLAEIAGWPLNFDPERTHDPEHGWRIDDYCEPLPSEPAGPPVAGGPFERCQELLREYKVADPKMVKAVYAHDAPLRGRNMLLKFRFGPIHFRAGCRVGDITDEERTEAGRPVRIWGWAYQTLEGHFEQGQMNWEAWKWTDTGDVQFRIHSYSRGTKSGNPILRLGFRMVGQWQRRLYLTHACERMAQMTRGDVEPG